MTADSLKWLRAKIRADVIDRLERADRAANDPHRIALFAKDYADVVRCAVRYFEVLDARRASSGVLDPEWNGVVELAERNLRAVIGWPEEPTDTERKGT